MRTPAVSSRTMIGLGLGATLLASSACTPKAVPPKHDASIDVMGVYAAAVRADFSGAQALARTGVDRSNAAGDAIMAMRFECAGINAHAAALDPGDHSREAEAVLERLMQAGAPRWVQGECAAVAGAAAATVYDEDRATRLMQRAFEADEADPHPNAERRAAIMVNRAMSTLSGPEANRVAAIGMMERALALEVDAKVPACPEQADTRIRLASIVVMEDPAAATAHVDRAQRDCEATDQSFAVGRVELARAHLAIMTGEANTALLAARKAWRAVETRGTLNDLARASLGEVWALRQLGRNDEARGLAIKRQMLFESSEHPAAGAAANSLEFELVEIERDLGLHPLAWDRLDSMTMPPRMGLAGEGAAMRAADLRCQLAVALQHEGADQLCAARSPFDSEPSVRSPATQ